jgi:hypothetical protein
MKKKSWCQALAPASMTMMSRGMCSCSDDLNEHQTRKKAYLQFCLQLNTQITFEYDLERLDDIDMTRPGSRYNFRDSLLVEYVGRQVDIEFHRFW